MPSNAFRTRSAEQQARLARDFPVKCLFQVSTAPAVAVKPSPPPPPPPPSVISPVKKILNSFLRPSSLIASTKTTVSTPRVLQEFNSHDNVIIGKSPKFSMFGQHKPPPPPPVNGTTTTADHIEEVDVMSKKQDADGPLIMTTEPEINDVRN